MRAAAPTLRCAKRGPHLPAPRPRRFASAPDSGALPRPGPVAGRSTPCVDAICQISTNKMGSDPFSVGKRIRPQWLCWQIAEICRRRVGPVVSAAWMPRPSPQERVYGVPCHRAHPAIPQETRFCCCSRPAAGTTTGRAQPCRAPNPYCSSERSIQAYFVGLQPLGHQILCRGVVTLGRHLQHFTCRTADRFVGDHQLAYHFPPVRAVGQARFLGDRGQRSEFPVGAGALKPSARMRSATSSSAAHCSVYCVSNMVCSELNIDPVTFQWKLCVFR